MMEQQRQIELQKDGDGKKERSQRNQEYLKELQYQIEELETERIEEAERKAEVGLNSIPLSADFKYGFLIFERIAGGSIDGRSCLPSSAR